ncbi:MAG: hypothetical protein ACOCR0_03070 [Haloferacaceae archaeon]
MNVTIRGEEAELADAVEDCGCRVVAPADADLTLAIGETGLLSLAQEPPGSPVLAIVAGGGIHAVARERVREALAVVSEGTYRTISHPVVQLSLDGEPIARAVEDAMLITAEPARISEYGLDTATGHAERFRADGVVVATPLGSDGYARAAGGPTVEADAGVSVVPVSPFSTHARTWVLNPPVTLTVERDEGEVVLLADDREVRTVPPWKPVELTTPDAFELVRTPQVGE